MSPAQFSENDPMGIVKFCTEPASAQPNWARFQLWSPSARVIASAVEVATGYQRKGLAHTAGLLTRWKSALIKAR
ncbi:Uncharacterised protein [Mycobacteroides abscessus subsp. abscessus]|nr:Uncharacterised protein [Mycobacteroides abscessus]SKV68286.1 Uncharacterised protein [Mycobacteroides abscessus subsp. abscessus]